MSGADEPVQPLLSTDRLPYDVNDLSENRPQVAYDLAQAMKKAERIKVKHLATEA